MNIILYNDYAVNFRNVNVNPVSISHSDPAFAGTTFSLTCSATLTNPTPLPLNVPCPNFEWFYDPNGNALFPSGVIILDTSTHSPVIYNSFL